MKIFLAILLIIVAAGVIYVISTSNPTVMPEPNAELSEHFQERLITLANSSGMMPIEGYDANLLISAYPGLVPADFEGVEAFEGHYEVNSGNIEFVRDQEEPISSAERTVSDAGYATLLTNVSSRLNVALENAQDVDSIIEIINTADTIRAQIDQGASAFGIKIIPLEVLEDSRCPTDVQCVQAGTVRLKTQVDYATSTKEYTFELNKAQQVQNHTVELTMVLPEAMSGQEIQNSEYEFRFEIAK